jgi:hypothetical protein
MFITLTRAANTQPLAVQVSRVDCVYPAPDESNTVVRFGDGHTIVVLGELKLVLFKLDPGNYKPPYAPDRPA